MHEVKLLIGTHNPTHSIYAGDLNTDTRTNSPQFVSDCDL